MDTYNIYLKLFLSGDFQTRYVLKWPLIRTKLNPNQNGPEKNKFTSHIGTNNVGRETSRSCRNKRWDYMKGKRNKTEIKGRTKIPDLCRDIN
jgi:hypothetical protein